MTTPTVKYYTYKKSAEAALLPGQVVKFLKGKGYYCYPPVTTSPGVTLPQGPFRDTTQGQYFRDASKPQEIAGIQVHDVADWGVEVMEWPPKQNTGRFNVHDIIAYNIGHTPPTQNGTKEFGVAIGQTSDVSRIAVNGTWSGLWIGAMANFCTFHDITVAKKDASGNWTLPVDLFATYNEHISHDNLFTRFLFMGPNMNEWWFNDGTYPAILEKLYPGLTTRKGTAGPFRNTWDTGRIWCKGTGKQSGLYLDNGGWGNKAKNITFDGPGDAIVEVGPLAGPDSNVIDLDSCTFLNKGKKYIKLTESGDNRAQTVDYVLH